VKPPQRILGAIGLSLLAMTGIAHAQATTNQLGIPVGAPNPGARSNPTTAQGVPAPASSAPGKTRYALPDTLSNQSHPAPTPTPKPGHLAVSGKVRGYSFDRIFNKQLSTNINKHATEFGLQTHLDYRVGDTPINIGYTYGGATGFGLNGPNPIANSKVDNTLPGYPLDQVANELYVQYKDQNAMFTVGDQQLNYPWLALSDSRVLPAAFAGIDSQVKLSSTLSAGITRVTKFEARNSSDFDPNTNLTAAYPGATLDKYHPFSPGTLRVDGNYHPASNIVISAENDDFYDIANMTYLEGKVGLAPTSSVNPYLASQVAFEGNDGRKYVGKVNDRTIGAQLGATAVKNLQVVVSGDFAPWQYSYVKAISTSKADSAYFIGGGGTGAVKAVGPDLYEVAYGGIASPYTDSLGTDPLYTTQITQGMVDRRSAGSSYKGAVIFTNQTKQLRLLVSEGVYDYSNQISRNITQEFNADGTVYLNKVRPGPYKGFFFRVRFAPRIQPASATTPQRFEYQRFQTEYDF